MNGKIVQVASGCTPDNTLSCQREKRDQTSAERKTLTQLRGHGHEDAAVQRCLLHRDSGKWLQSQRKQDKTQQSNSMVFSATEEEAGLYHLHSGHGRVGSFEKLDM